jgi:hypothetical protein
VVRPERNTTQPETGKFIAEVIGMIDRKITLGLILALFVESACVFAWAGATGERLKDVEVKLAMQSIASERLARVEVKLDLVAAQLTRVERRVEQR